MSCKHISLGPNVRVGVLQCVPQARFRASGALDVFDSRGERLGEIESGLAALALVRNTVPCRSVYRIRLGVFSSPVDATDYLDAQLAGRTEMVYDLTCPLVKEAGRRTVLDGVVISDNREFWAMVGEFKTDSEAQVFLTRLLEKYPNGMVLRDVVSRSRGIVEIVDKDTGNVLFRSGDYLRVVPRNESETRIAVYDVLVGIQFHWEHRETQAYRGLVDFVVDNDGLLTVVSELSIEEYLYSVNSSEMLAVCPEELLKAQTICARNTVLATVARHHVDDPFDVCADDHCQCYRGATRETPRSIRAANLTRGEVLVHSGKVCDTRYAKICGGIMEPADNVWWEGDIPYLRQAKDSSPETARTIRYIESESDARTWIDSTPDVYCNTLSDDLPEELSYARKYFRWKVEYTRQEVENLLRTRVDVDVGQLLDLVPLERGPSGRLIWLEVVGAEGKRRIGKELVIRRALSSTHLYSSAFYVEKEMGSDELPSKFILHGAGWGHGVGLCQVGAAVMAHRGFDYRQILAHYYAGSSLERLYGEECSDVPEMKDLSATYAILKDMLCWELLNCYDAMNCPVLTQGKGDRCWEFLGTQCFGEMQDTWEVKKTTCAHCTFYQMKNGNADGE